MSLKPPGRKYYGPFFWLSVVTFLVPLVVAYTAFQSVRPTTKPTPSPDASGVDQAVWDYLLKSYVEDGLVDYDGMSRDYLFRTYIRQVGAADPAALPTEDDRLAFYCNAYNALVVNGVITHRVTDSVMNYRHADLGFFDTREHVVAGRTMSLNELEHQLIRPTFRDPRVHVALVCAARGCPPIRPEAYTGQWLGRQLDDQVSLFANDPKYVAYDAGRDTLVLSPILKWYADDWGPGGGVLTWLAPRVSDETVRAAVRRANAGTTNVTYSEYDWSLNSRRPPGAQAGKAAKGNFGSGTIPND